MVHPLLQSNQYQRILADVLLSLTPIPSLANFCPVPHAIVFSHTILVIILTKNTSFPIAHIRRPPQVQSVIRTFGRKWILAITAQDMPPRRNIYIRYSNFGSDVSYHRLQSRIFLKTSYKALQRTRTHLFMTFGSQRFFMPCGTQSKGHSSHPQGTREGLFSALRWIASTHFM